MQSACAFGTWSMTIDALSLTPPLYGIFQGLIREAVHILHCHAVSPHINEIASDLSGLPPCAGQSSKSCFNDSHS